MSSEMQPQSPPLYAFEREGGPGCLLQLVWFIFIGWWLGLGAILLAWLLNITILGLPLGLLILNNIPKIIALQGPRREYAVITQDGRPVLRASGLPQINFFLRALYFVLIGWWWSAVWLLVAYLLCATILLLPVGLIMFRFVPLMTTLKRY
jgi:uncharacterized membrane protein YccF (DUF307 family)